MKRASFFALFLSSITCLGFCEQPTEEVVPEEQKKIVAPEIAAPEAQEDANVVFSEESIENSMQGAFFGF
jgi:hypothetical protein